MKMVLLVLRHFIGGDSWWDSAILYSGPIVSSQIVRNLGYIVLFESSHMRLISKIFTAKTFFTPLIGITIHESNVGSVLFEK